MKKVLIILLILTFNFNFTYSQNTGINNSSITVDALGFFTNTVSVSYAYRIDDKYEIRINPKISLSGRDGNTIMGFVVEDAYWYYDSYGVQIGLSRSIYKKLYLEPIIYYKYGTFKSKELQTSDNEGDEYDEFQTLSRDYNSGGIGLQSGLIIDKNHFRFNPYLGIGYHLRYYHEEIFEKRIWDFVEPEDYPIKTNYWKDGLSLYLGIRIGFRM